MLSILISKTKLLKHFDDNFKAQQNIVKYVQINMVAPYLS